VRLTGAQPRWAPHDLLVDLLLRLEEVVESDRVSQDRRTSAAGVTSLAVGIEQALSPRALGRTRCASCRLLASGPSAADRPPAQGLTHA
jgi:hypothetical protein